ncbi:hypothetical protein ABH897_005527 [Paenibacillus sp. RC73]|uniref:hypothetical protein n=1 Tax=Paenibacillus sp. RC73 TaxID=3156250 RepID=UPI003839A8F6
MYFDFTFYNKVKNEKKYLKKVTDNDSRFDCKYIREVHGTTYHIGQRVTLKDEYLRGVICVLEGLAAEASAIIIERITRNIPKSRIADSRRTFNYAISTGLRLHWLQLLFKPLYQCRS